MAAIRNGTRAKLLDHLLTETSRLILHAMAVPASEAAPEWLRAAAREEEAACLLEAEGRDIDAATHFVSAGSCYARAEDYARAMPLLRAALSFTLRDVHRRRVEKLLKEWRPKAKTQLRRRARAQAALAS